MKSNLKLQEIVNSVKYSNNKVEFVPNVYFKLIEIGYSPVVINDKYIEIDGVNYEFTHSQPTLSYIVKED